MPASKVNFQWPYKTGRSVTVTYIFLRSGFGDFSPLFATDGGELCNSAVMRVISTPTHSSDRSLGSVARYLSGIEEIERRREKRKIFPLHAHNGG